MMMMSTRGEGSVGQDRMDWLVIVDGVVGEGLKAPHSVCGMT